MVKKLLLIGASTVAVCAMMLLAPTSSAAYYDCDGNYHDGNPSSGECYKLLAPSVGSNSTNGGDTQVHTPQGSSNTQSHTPADSCGSDFFGNPTGDCSDDSSSSGAGVDFSDTNPYSVTTHSPYMSASEYLGRDLSDYGYTDTDPDDYYKKYEKRNERRYCVRDNCYYLYDWCYDEFHCEEKSERTPRPNYNYEYAGDQDHDDDDDKDEPREYGNSYQKNTWNYYKSYVNNYFYNNMPQYQKPERQQDRDCDYRNRDCVYRGFKFGGYHNGYWHY